MIMIVDWDILTSLACHNISSSLVLGSTLHYLIKQIDTILYRRRQELLQKKPGAVSKNPTKIIWVRMLKRSNQELLSMARKAAIGLRGKFNSALEERILDGTPPESHHIMSIEVRNHEFHHSGKLTLLGKEEFWKEINRALKRFDANEISLKPHKFQATPKIKVHENRKLPTPLPKRKSRSKTPKQKRSRSRTPSRSHNRNSPRDEWHRRSSHRDRSFYLH